MFWPFGFHPPNQPQYLSNLPNFFPSFLPDNLASSLFNNFFGPGFCDFYTNYASFSQDHPLTLNLPNFNQSGNFENHLEPEQSPISQNTVHHQQNSLSNPQISKKSSSSNEGSIQMVRFRRRRKVKRQKNKISHNSSLRNDTKNIPKNYGKAMLTYIQKNTRQLKQLLSDYNADFMDFMMVVKEFKNKINTIHDLREMWGENAKDDQVKKCIRIASYQFMRKKCLSYIFNSRIKNYRTHIKYRKKIMEGIADPDKFTTIKQF